MQSHILKLTLLWPSQRPKDFLAIFTQKGRFGLAELVKAWCQDSGLNPHMGHSLHSELHLTILVNPFQPREFCEHFPCWMAFNYSTSFLTPESWTLWNFFLLNITFHPFITCLDIFPLCPEPGTTCTLSKPPLLTVHQHKAQLKAHSTSRMGHYGEGKFIMITENESCGN